MDISSFQVISVLYPVESVFSLAIEILINSVKEYY